MKQKRLSIFVLTLALGSFAAAGIVHSGFAEDVRSEAEKSEADLSQNDGLVDRFGIEALHEGGGYGGGGYGPGPGPGSYGPGGDFRWIQERLERAERMISNLQNRLGYLEQRLNQPLAPPQAPPYYPGPFPPRSNPRGWACSLQDDFGGQCQPEF